MLIIDSIDAASGAGVEKAADAAGVKVIDYDRVNLGGTAPYYVSFDNEDVGKLQAQTLLDCLTQQGVTDPKIIEMDGGTDVDNNAVLFKKGAQEVFSASRHHAGRGGRGQGLDRLQRGARPSPVRSPPPVARSTVSSPPTTTSPTR